MSLPTYTRAALRQAICRELRMPFFTRYAGSSSVTTGSLLDRFVDSALTQEDKFWNYSYIYMKTGNNLGLVRQVDDFDSKSDTLILDVPMPVALTTGDTYEIQSKWNANEIHDAINRAIDAGFSAFFDTCIDETLIVVRDKLQYDLTALAKKPWRVTKAWLERPFTMCAGTATGGSTNTLVNTQDDFNARGAKAGWLVSIFYATGAGQLGTVASVSGDGHTITLSGTWAVAPDATTQYRLWDPNVQRLPWERTDTLSFDTKEFPSTLWLSGGMVPYWGYRIRLQYLFKPPALTLDADATVVPEEFIVPRALHYLLQSRVGDNRSDQAATRLQSQDYLNFSEQYKSMKGWDVPDATMWRSSDETTYSWDALGDPLGWGGS